MNGRQFRKETHKFAEQNGFSMSTCSANIVFPEQIVQNLQKCNEFYCAFMKKRNKIYCVIII